MNDEQRPSEQPGAGQWAEEALRESEARFRNLLQDVQSVSVQGYGPDGTTQYWNQASERLYGYSAEEAIGRNLVDLIIPPEMRGNVEQAIRQMAETGQPIPASELSLMRKDGSRVSVFSSHAIIHIPGRTQELFCVDIDITDRKQAEESLREREAQNLALISAFPDILFTNHRDGEFLAVHTSHPELLFAPPETFLHRKVEEIMPKPLADQFMKAFADALDLEAVQELNYALPVGGEERRLEARVTPCAKDTVITIVRDVTERKQAEDALRKSDARFRSYFNMPLHGIAITSPDKGWIEVNDRICSILGYPRDELFHMNWAELTHPDDLAADVEQFDRVLSGQIEQYAMEKRFIRKDGRAIWTNITVGCIRKSDGCVDYIIGLMEDITQRKRAEEELKESEQKFRDIFNNTTDAIYICEVNDDSSPGRFIDVNEVGLRMLGYSKEEMLTKAPFEITTGNFNPPIEKILEEQQTTGTSMFETEHRRKDGSTVTVELNSHMVTILGKEVLLGVARDITDRKQAEEALQESEEKYRALVENANEAIIVTQEGVLKFANPRVSKLLGYSIEQVVGRPFIELIHPDDRNLVAERYRKRLEGELPAVVYPFRTLHQDGSIRWAEINSVRIAWEGKPAIMSYLSDITERKQAEEELRESEERYRLINDASLDFVYSYDKTDRFTSANRSLCAALGLRTEQILGKTHAELGFPVAQSQDWDDLHRRVYETGTTVTAFTSTPMPDGIIRQYEVVLNPLHDHAGAITGIAGTTRDITERKQAEEALRESEDRYRTLLENMGEGIGFVNPEEQFGFTNAASEDIFGVPSNGLQGRSLHEFANPEQFGLIREQTKRRQAGEKSVYEIEISRPSGEKRDLLVMAVPQFDSQGKFVGALGVFRDITERKRLEQEMTKARADFLFAVSHELKTPLFLMASAQELLESLPQEQRAGRFLEYGEIWNRNLHRLRHLIENLVDSQRTEGMGQKITLVPTDIKEILQQALKDVELPARRRRISFHLQLDELPLIPADPESIHRLFENLLTNAIKFSPPNGEVEISLRCEGEEALFTVRDYGPGIAALEIPQLFQPFQRTSGANRAVIPGTGLGLYTAKLIVEAHGGSISLYSELGKGTTVVVSLPIYPHPQKGADDA